MDTARNDQKLWTGQQDKVVGNKSGETRSRNELKAEKPLPSSACAKAEASLTESKGDEFEEILRAGAT